MVTDELMEKPTSKRAVDADVGASKRPRQSKTSDARQNKSASVRASTSGAAQDTRAGSPSIQPHTSSAVQHQPDAATNQASGIATSPVTDVQADSGVTSQMLPPNTYSGGNTVYNDQYPFTPHPHNSAQWHGASYNYASTYQPYITSQMTDSAPSACQRTQMVTVPLAELNQTMQMKYAPRYGGQ